MEPTTRRGQIEAKADRILARVTNAEDVAALLDWADPYWLLEAMLYEPERVYDVLRAAALRAAADTLSGVEFPEDRQ